MTSMPDHAHAPNQFALLGQRRYAPFFWTQFLGAANDNLFKFGLIIMITYQVQIAWLPPSMAGLVIAAVFILPFLLFSGTSGQLADKWEKARLMRAVKNMEIGIMVLVVIGFEVGNVALLLGCIFLMGLHSTLFGPAKYAYLPQVLADAELTGGTGMVEMGTFVAILLGQMAGGLLVAIPVTGQRYVALSCLGLAILGRVSAGAIQHIPATDPGLRVNWNPLTETWRNLQRVRGNRDVFQSLLGISWMWFFGAIFLSQYPNMARELLHGDAQVASLLLIVFSIGLGVGSVLCELLNRSHIEIGLVPLGALGMSVFCVDLYFALQAVPAAPEMGFHAFLQVRKNWRVIADFGLVSLFTGIFSVPMYALVQLRSPPSHRARVIAANNILNALFMIGSSLIAGALLAAHVGLASIILLTGLANVVATGLIFCLLPEYPARSMAWLATRIFGRLVVNGLAASGLEQLAVLRCPALRPLDAARLTALSARSLCVVQFTRKAERNAAAADYPATATATASWIGRLFWRAAQRIAVSSTASASDLAGLTERIEAARASGRLLCLEALPSDASAALQAFHKQLLTAAPSLQLTLDIDRKTGTFTTL